MSFSSDLDLAIKRAKAEILDDIENGRVPADVTTFRELHDHVDANEYGGLCEDSPMSTRTLVVFGNELQRQLNLWLRAGRPDSTNKATVQVPGTVIAHYEGGAITEIVFMPHGSNAGYFGPSAELSDGDEDLEIEDTEGPFWTAMQKYIAGSDEPVISWRE